MIKSLYTLVLLCSGSLLYGQVCTSTYPIDSIAFDATFFTKVDNVVYGINGQKNSWSTAFGDYDNDGFVDLFVANYDTNRINQLYHNNGDGTFTAITSGNPIVADSASSTSGVWGDYDNDGNLDLFVSNSLGYDNFLYHNDGGGMFTRVLNDPIVNYLGYSHGATWVDYDQDGFLDMFVPEYFSLAPNRLYHNNGNGTFSVVLNSAVTIDAAASVSSVWGDYDNDGDQDLFVANTNNLNNFLYQNDGNGVFTKITTGDIVNDGRQSVGASWGDYDNDGDLDLFVANSGNQNNLLYANNGDGTFTKITNSIVTTISRNSHGSAWADFDNDGDLDLLVTNDAGDDNELYINDGSGNFVAADNQIIHHSGESFGAAWADIDNDNDLDLHIANHDAEENFLYINNYGTCNNTAGFDLTGTVSNALAIGSQVRILATINGVPTWQLREIASLTGGGIGGQNDSRVLFGLGDATQIDSMVIKWASGFVEVFTNISANNAYEPFIEPNTSEVCGVVYDDLNRNCQQDNGEVGIAGIPVVAQPGNIQTYTNQDGKYQFDLTIGTYTLTALDTLIWAQSCAVTTQTVAVIAIADKYCGFDFADTVVCQSPDLYVALSASPQHIGLVNTHEITVGNNSIQTANAAILMVNFGAHISPLTASLPWNSNNGTTYIWNLTAIEMNQILTIYVEDSLSATATMTDNLIVTATIMDNIQSDCNPANNMQSTEGTAAETEINSIQVSPEGLILRDEELIYTIQFRNIGSGFDKIVIKSKLPEYFDLSTFANQDISHPYEFSIKNEQTLVWEFEGMHLLDPAEEGSITFKITPKSEISVGTEIKNKAMVFLDNSTPITTNTVINVIDKLSTVPSGSIGISPNPMNSFTDILLNSNDETIESVVIYSVVGVKMVSFSNVAEKRLRIENKNLSPGYYMVRVTSNLGNLYTAKLLVL